MVKGPVYKFPFVPLGKSMIFKCQEWRTLSPAARDVYIILKATFNGSNNGDLQLYYRQLQNVKGLKNAGTISKAFRELEVNEWIERTQTGGLFRRPNKYRLTGKFDKHIYEKRI